MIVGTENYNISREVLKFRYNGNFENNDNEMFSEKFCCYRIEVRKKVTKKIKWAIFYGELTSTFINWVTPSQAIGLPIFPTTAPVSRSMNFNSAKPKIAPFIQNIPDKVIYTESKIYELHQSVFNQFKKGNDVQQVIHELVWILIQPLVTAAVVYMMYINRVQGFQTVHHYP